MFYRNRLVKVLLSVVLCSFLGVACSERGDGANGRSDDDRDESEDSNAEVAGDTEYGETGSEGTSEHAKADDTDTESDAAETMQPEAIYQVKGPYIFDVLADDENLYWTESSTRDASIWTMPKTGGGKLRLEYGGGETLPLVLGDEHLYWFMVDTLYKLSTKDLSIEKKNIGIQILDVNSRMCGNSQYLFIVSDHCGNVVRVSKKDGSVQETDFPEHNNEGLGQVISADENNLYCFPFEVLLDNKIYALSVEKNELKILSDSQPLNSEPYYQPWAALVIDDYLYWSAYWAGGRKQYLMRIHTRSGKKENVISIEKPASAFHFDRKRNTLYWVNGGTRHAFIMSHVLGSDEVKTHAHGKVFVWHSMTADDDYIYWPEKNDVAEDGSRRDHMISSIMRVPK